MHKTQQDRLREFLLYTNALLESMETSVSADSESVWKYAGYKQYTRKYNQLITALSKIMKIDAIVDFYDVEKIPDAGKTWAIYQKEVFESIHANLSILRAYLERKIDLKADEVTNLRNFLQANLRKVVFDMPDREIDVQNAVEQLLIGRGLTKGLDYDRETGRVKVSIKEVVPDFIFQRLGLALEVKLSKDRSKSKAIVDEINADITAYSTGYSFLLFVVYDLGTIRDEVEFKQDLEKMDNVSVIVVKH